MDVGSVSAVIGALGIGSVAGQYVASSSARRATRADALRALGQCESSRWEPLEAGEPTFNEASRHLQAAALVAHLPRKLVQEYLIYARACWWMSQDSAESGDPETPGNVLGPFPEVVREAAAGLADVIWAPRFTRRLIEARRLRQVASRFGAMDARHATELVAMARDYGARI